jgi:hypothetical protein
LLYFKALKGDSIFASLFNVLSFSLLLFEIVSYNLGCDVIRGLGLVGIFCLFFKVWSGFATVVFKGVALLPAPYLFFIYKFKFCECYVMDSGRIYLYLYFSVPFF